MTALSSLQIGAMAIALLCLVVASIWDVVRFEIPNALCATVFAGALIFGAAQPGFDWPSHLASPALVLFAGMFVFARGWMGGGDIKLLVATAAWAGLAGLPLQLALISVAGGILAVTLGLIRRLQLAWHPNGTRRERLFNPGSPLPYAVAIASGSITWEWLAQLSP